jgi:hypothetical protein
MGKYDLASSARQRAKKLGHHIFPYKVYNLSLFVPPPNEFSKKACITRDNTSYETTINFFLIAK